MYLGKGPQFNAAKLEGIRVVIIFADGYSDEWPGLALGPSWMQPEQEQALEDFVAAGGSFMPLHNSMWGYPIGVHPKHDEATLAAMAAELTEVSGKLRDSTKPTTTVEVGLGDEAKMGPYRRVCGGEQQTDSSSRRRRRRSSSSSSSSPLCLYQPQPATATAR
jgi:hypothetical protein